MKNFFALLRMIFSPKTFPSLKAFRLAFRKYKGAFISGAKENNSCAEGCEGGGRGIAPNADVAETAEWSVAFRVFEFVVVSVSAFAIGFAVYTFVELKLWQ